MFFFVKNVCLFLCFGCSSCCSSGMILRPAASKLTQNADEIILDTFQIKWTIDEKFWSMKFEDMISLFLVGITDRYA